MKAEQWEQQDTAYRYRAEVEYCEPCYLRRGQLFHLHKTPAGEYLGECPYEGAVPRQGGAGTTAV